MLVIELCWWRTIIWRFDRDGFDILSTLLLKRIAPFRVNPFGITGKMGPAQEQQITFVDFAIERTLPVISASQAFDIKENVHLRPGLFHTLNNGSNAVSVLTGVGHERRENIFSCHFNFLFKKRRTLDDEFQFCGNKVVDVHRCCLKKSVVSNSHREETLQRRNRDVLLAISRSLHYLRFRCQVK